MTRRSMVTLVASVLGMAIAAGAATAHPNHERKVLGTVTTATAERLVVKDRQGKEVTMQVTAETKILKNKKPARIEDVIAGSRVTVTTITEKEQLLAKVIEIGTLRPTATKS